MYLSALNGNQKHLFLDLALHLATADGTYSDDEKIMMDAYCQEMQLPSLKKNGTPPKPLDEIVNCLSKEGTERERRIILYEAVGLAMVDGKYDNKERAFINSIQEKFGLPKNFCGQCEAVLNEYFNLQARINGLVVG